MYKENDKVRFDMVIDKLDAKGVKFPQLNGFLREVMTNKFLCGSDCKPFACSSQWRFRNFITYRVK